MSVNLSKTPLGRTVKSIENADLTNRKEIINSPRSVEALRALGYEMIELQFVTLKEFIESRPDLKNVPSDIQSKRYYHHEEKRQDKVRKVVEKRKQLYEDNKSKVIKSKTSSNFFSNPDVHSSAVQQDQAKLEKLKKKEINDLQSIIDYELKLEEIRENNTKKLLAQQEKEEKIKQEKQRKTFEESLKRRMKEHENQRKLQAEEERTNRLIKEREEKERLKEMEERKMKELLYEEKKRKMYQQKIKDEEFKKQIEDIFLEQQSKLLERQRQMNEKDEFRKKMIEHRKYELSLSNKKKSQANQMKITKTIQKKEKRLEDQRVDFENKQKFLEETKRRFNIAKEEYKNYQNLLARYKEMEVKKILEKNVQLEKDKISNYHQKKEEIHQRKLLKQEEEKRSLSEKLFSNQMKQKKIVDTLSRYEQQKEIYRQSLIEKINEVDQRICAKKSDHKLSLTTKFDNMAMSREDKYERVLLYEKQQQYLRELKMENINERMKKIEEMKKQKSLIAEEKRMMVDVIKRKKREMLEELEFKLHKGKLNKEEFYDKLTNVIGNVGDGSLDFSRSKTFSKSLKAPSKFMDYEETYENLVEQDKNNNFLTKQGQEDPQVDHGHDLEDPQMEDEKLETEDFKSPEKSEENKELERQRKIIEYKSHLDHNLYDLITKCSVEEKSLQKLMKESSNEELRAQRAEELKNLMKENEKTIAASKKEIKQKVEEFEKRLQ